MTAELAREVALRDGVKAVLEGEAADVDPSVRPGAHDRMAWLAVRGGPLAEAREHLLAAERIGAESSAALWWFRRMWTAASEAFVGDPAAAADLMREANLPAAFLNYLWVLPRRASLREEVGDTSGALGDYRRLVEL